MQSLKRFQYLKNGEDNENLLYLFVQIFLKRKSRMKIGRIVGELRDFTL